jgi:hypothetical protein
LPSLPNSPCCGSISYHPFPCSPVRVRDLEHLPPRCLTNHFRHLIAPLFLPSPPTTPPPGGRCPPPCPHLPGLDPQSRGPHGPPLSCGGPIRLQYWPSSGQARVKLWSSRSQAISQGVAGQDPPNLSHTLMTLAQSHTPYLTIYSH